MTGEISGVQVTLAQIYELLIEVRDEVKSLHAEVRTLREVSEDHERRLREIESHGSGLAQTWTQDMARSRDRLHTLEGTSLTHTAFISENTARIVELKQEQQEAVDEIKDALRWALRFTAGTAASLAVTIIAFVLTHSLS